MRNTHLTQSWGFLAAIGICLALACSPGAVRAVQGAAPTESTIIDKVVVRNLPFNDGVRMLAMQSGLRLVMRVDNDTPITLNFPNPTPVEEILKAATSAVDLEFWKNDDTYIIGKRAVIIDP
ncbi:MAG TPA: hypothetical protein PK794_09880, partial [Armatimonadota bacterium]|nr:hypothetical protein [Armatimonadota bacterium]